MPTKTRREKERARREPLSDNIGFFIDIVNNERYTFPHSFDGVEDHRFTHPLRPYTYTVSLSPIPFDASMHTSHAEVRAVAIKIADAFVAHAATGNDLPKKVSAFDEPFPCASLLAGTAAASIDWERDSDSLQARGYAQLQIEDGARTAVDVVRDAAITLVFTGTYRLLRRCASCDDLFLQMGTEQGLYCTPSCRRSAAYRRRLVRQTPSSGK